MKILGFGVALLSVVALTGHAHAADKLVVGAVPAMANTVLYVAKDEKIFEKNGLDVEIVHSAGSAVVPGIVSGSMQLSIPAVPVLLQAIDNGLDLKIVSGLNVTSTSQLDFGVVVGNNSNITSAKDYVGKTVATPNINGFTDLLFREWLKVHNVDPSKVTSVEVPFPQMGDVLRQGTVQAAQTLQPFMARMLVNNVGKLGPNYLEGLPDRLPVVFVAATNEWAKKNSDIIDRFTTSLKEALVVVEKDKDRAKATSNKYLKLPDDAKDQVPVPVYELTVNTDRLVYWINLMKSLSLVRTDMSPSKLIFQK